MKYPKYQILIPPQVRYDKSLSPSAKLLYGEIAALCDKEGYCWAGNEYFATLYEVKEKAVSRWVGELAKKEHLHIEITKGNQRKIYLSTDFTKRDKAILEKGKAIPFFEDTDSSKRLAKDGSHLNVIYFIDNNDRVYSPLKKNWGRIKEKNMAANGQKKEVKNAPTHRLSKYPSPSRRPPRTKAFVRPAYSEVESFMMGQKELCPGRITASDMAQKFFNYYESNGWKVGRNKMQNWKAAARNWLLNAKDFQTPKPTIYESRQNSSEGTGISQKNYSIPL